MKTLDNLRRKISRTISPRGETRTTEETRTAEKISHAKKGADEIVNRVKHSSSSEHETRVSTRKYRASKPANSPTISPATSPRLKRSSKVSRTNGAPGEKNNPGLSPRIQPENQRTSPQEQQRKMKEVYNSVENNNKNLDHYDLMKVFRWEMKNNFAAISQEEVDSFVKIKTAEWKSEGDGQLAKWKRHYSQAEHDLVNHIDRQMCYDAFCELSKKYKIKTDASGGKYIDFPKGVSAAAARKEITAFVKSEKTGAEFRWAEAPELKDKIMGFNQRLNVTDDVTDAQFFGYYRLLGDAFVADPGFQKWARSAEHPVSPFSEKFRSEFIQLHRKHQSLTKKNESIYTPGENGREYLAMFIIGEVKRNPGYVGWSEEAKKSFKELLDAFQDKSKLFKPKYWANFRDIMLKDPLVAQQLKLPRKQRRTAEPSQDVFVPQPLKFEDPGIEHLLNPYKHSKEKFLLLCYEQHLKKAESFEDAVMKVAQDADTRRPEISRFDIEKYLEPQRQYFQLRKATD